MRNLDNKAKILIADIRQISWRNQIMFVIALYCFSISKEKIDQVISLALHKLAKKDIERFWSAGIKASLINVKSPSYFKKWKILKLIMMQNQIVFSFFFLVFTLNMKDYDIIMRLNWILKAQTLQYLGK